MTLHINDLHFAYDQDPILAGVTLTVPPGTHQFLVGPSGCGKSTLLRCIAGLERNYQGTVQVSGRVIDDQAPHQRPVGMLFQEPALFPHMNVWQNVAFGLRYRNVARHERHDEALRWLDVVGLTHKDKAPVDELSGGQRQRVALARTLAAKPQVVLLDEPLAALDADLRVSLGDRIRKDLQQQGVAALWVTHDEAEAARIGDEVHRLDEGRARPWVARAAKADDAKENEAPAQTSESK